MLSSNSAPSITSVTSNRYYLTRNLTPPPPLLLCSWASVYFAFSLSTRTLRLCILSPPPLSPKTLGFLQYVRRRFFLVGLSLFIALVCGESTRVLFSIRRFYLYFPSPTFSSGPRLLASDRDILSRSRSGHLLYLSAFFSFRLPVRYVLISLFHLLSPSYPSNLCRRSTCHYSVPLFARAPF